MRVLTNTNQKITIMQDFLPKQRELLSISFTFPQKMKMWQQIRPRPPYTIPLLPVQREGEGRQRERERERVSVLGGGIGAVAKHLLLTRPTKIQLKPLLYDRGYSKS